MDGTAWAQIILALFCGSTVLTLAIGVAQWLDKRGGRRAEPGLPADPSKRAIAILQERYARGEIDRDEYLERRGYIALEDHTS